MRLTESIIFTVLGALITTMAIILNSGWEIILLGSIITAAGVGCIVQTRIKNKREKSKK